jgi:hypothetical protein
MQATSNLFIYRVALKSLLNSLATPAIMLHVAHPKPAICPLEFWKGILGTLFFYLNNE